MLGCGRTGYQHPLVLDQILPADEGNSATATTGAGEVGEHGSRIVEEHDPKRLTMASRLPPPKRCICASASDELDVADARTHGKSLVAITPGHNCGYRDACRQRPSAESAR